LQLAITYRVPSKADESDPDLVYRIEQARKVMKYMNKGTKKEN